MRNNKGIDKVIRHSFYIALLYLIITEALYKFTKDLPELIENGNVIYHFIFESILLNDIIRNICFSVIGSIIFFFILEIHNYKMFGYDSILTNKILYEHRIKTLCEITNDMKLYEDYKSGKSLDILEKYGEIISKKMEKDISEKQEASFIKRIIHLNEISNKAFYSYEIYNHTFICLKNITQDYLRCFCDNFEFLKNYNATYEKFKERRDELNKELKELKKKKRSGKQDFIINAVEEYTKMISDNEDHIKRSSNKIRNHITESCIKEMRYLINGLKLIDTISNDPIKFILKNNY